MLQVFCFQQKCPKTLQRLHRHIIGIPSTIYFLFLVNVREYRRDNPEKLLTLGTQDEEKQSKNTIQYVLDTTLANKPK